MDDDADVINIFFIRGYINERVKRTKDSLVWLNRLQPAPHSLAAYADNTDYDADVISIFFYTKTLLAKRWLNYGV